MDFLDTRPVGPNHVKLDTQASDLTLDNATTLLVVSTCVGSNLDHGVMMQTAARLIQLHVLGNIDLTVERELAAMVNAGLGLLLNYDLGEGTRHAAAAA